MILFCLERAAICIPNQAALDLLIDQANVDLLFLSDREFPLNGVDDDGRDGYPTRFGIVGVYPNPFNSTTHFTISVPMNSHVVVRIYNILGKEVDKLYDANAKPGYLHVQWNPRATASGTYYVSVEAKGFTKQQAIQYLR